MSQFASRTTYGSIANGDTLTIEGGDDVEVRGFVISNVGASANSTCHVHEFGDSDAIIFELELDSADSVVMDIPFVAHKGIVFFPQSSESNVFDVTCFHNSPGSGVTGGLNDAAPRYTRHVFTDNATMTVAGGEPVTVHGIVVTNEGGSSTRDVELQDADGTTLGQFRVLASVNVVINVPFMANNGIQIVANDTDEFLSATVLHSNPGA